MQSRLTEYEKEREDRIAQNEQKMRDMGLSKAVATLKGTANAPTGKGKKKKTPCTDNAPRRISSRLNPDAGEGRNADYLNLGSEDEDEDPDYNSEELDSSSTDGSTSHEDMSGEEERNLGSPPIEGQGQQKPEDEPTHGRY